MMPKARPRRDTRRGLGWPFGRRRNRRVRPASVETPVAAVARGVATGVKRRGRALVVVGLALAAGAAAFGAHHYVTRARYFAVRSLRFSPTKHVAAESLEARAGAVVG